MLSPLIAFAAISFSVNLEVNETNLDEIYGHWKGIPLFQDQNSYDGKTFYLPNSEELIIDKNRVRVYFYPYFKSDEFEAAVTPKSIVYTIDKKKVKSDYSFNGDTLILSMNFINKNFIKMYKRVDFDPLIIEELDQYGFNPSSLEHEFELDTLHKELRRGFSTFDQLLFKPFQNIQFMSDSKFRVNKTTVAEFVRGYQKIVYQNNGVTEEFTVYKVQGTQQISIIPTSLCQCDSIIVPYLTVSWANRIRKQIADDTW